MNRTQRILQMARDYSTMQLLEVPRYESTKGLDKDEINCLLSRQEELFHKDFPKKVLTDIHNNIKNQSPEVTSTEKLIVTRSRNVPKLPKKPLFHKNEIEMPSNLKDTDMVTSTYDADSDPYEDSGSEYVPDSENTSESEPETDDSDHELDVDIKVINDIIINPAPTLSQENKVLGLAENTISELSCEIDKNTESREQGLSIACERPEQNKELNRKVVLNSKNKREWNKKDYCIFCDEEVMKFSRHLLRHHQTEVEVQEILALDVGDKKRKVLFNMIRNRGNFLKSATSENVIPVRKPTSRNLDLPTVNTYLPCKYCKGFYKKKSLYRHVKKCYHNDGDKTVKCMAQSEGQSLFTTYRHHDILREKLFPTMRADQISFVAKTDPLICAVARRYLKSHHEKQSLAVASRKMRQLAALLIELRKKIEAKSLMKALDPTYFDKIVECTKIISRYDPDTETYGAPSLASHMGGELKDCIDVACNMCLKKYNAGHEATKKLKSLKDLISSEWRYEVSTLANRDLQQKHWNKPSLIPLAEDLTLLKRYLTNESEKCRSALQLNPTNAKAFKTLQEITYVQLLLLNRRRVGELQRMTVVSYTTNINNEASSEFDAIISENEKVLMKSFKRVVIRGKRGRGVPVLFTAEMVKNTNLLLQLRDGFVRHGNQHLFANVKSSASISGSKAIYHHVRLAGVKNPHALTSTKLRKHLATMSQVINMSEQDMEQLANFMGHTLEVHKSHYRLPNDIYQMAKVSKLLLLNEKGQAAQYKGRRLDEIDINLDIIEEDDNSEVSSDDEKEYSNQQEENINVNKYRKEIAATSINNNQAENTDTSNVVPQKKKRILQPWTEEQKRVVLSYFENHLKKKIPPKKNETVKLIDENHDLFHNKSWEKIKIFVVNTYNKK